MYADDLVGNCKADREEAKIMKECLQTYYSWTGQEINFNKSSVYFSQNVKRSAKMEICRILVYLNLITRVNTWAYHSAILSPNHKLSKRWRISWLTRWLDGRQGRFQWLEELSLSKRWPMPFLVMSYKHSCYLKGPWEE